jgi:Reverse transcriptase (RNA-dependent DNA polymerase)/GIY-YIG catalytic domain
MERLLEDTDRIALFQTRVKIHKEGAPLRPIVSQVGTPCSKINKIIVEGINSLNEKNEYKLKDTAEFKKMINKVKIEEGDIVFSMDVCDMFSNVPVGETIGIVANNLHKVKTKLPKPDFLELLQLGVGYNTFEHEGRIYQQKEGFPMGSSLSPALCEVFMNDYEVGWMKDDELKPEIYKRYVDDGFGVWKKGREKFEIFKDKINTMHDNIKWTFEEMKDGKLPFLDCEVMLKEGKLTTKVYRKPTHSGAYIDYRSNHSMNTKHGIIRILTKRAKEYCEKEEDLSDELVRINKEFMMNGYPREEVKKVIKGEMEKSKPKKKVTWEDEDKAVKEGKKKRWIVVNRMTNISGKIRRVCQKFGIKVIEKPTRKIEQILTKKKEKEKDPVGVIYEIRCKTCGECYIGETGRRLSVRINEHKRDCKNKKTDKSSVAEHQVKYDHEIEWEEVRVLGLEKNKVKRKLKEAIQIAKYRPKMNENEGWYLPQEWKDTLRYWDIPVLERQMPASSATSQKGRAQESRRGRDAWTSTPI